MMFNHFVVVVSANELFSLTVVLVIRCLDLFRISKFGFPHFGSGRRPGCATNDEKFVVLRKFLGKSSGTLIFANRH